MLKYPDRTATRINYSHYYTNLDGQGGMSLADQAENVQKEQMKQIAIQQLRRVDVSQSGTPRSFYNDNNPGEIIAPAGAIHIGSESSYESIDIDDVDVLEEQELLQRIHDSKLQEEEERKNELEDEAAKSITMDQAQQVLRSATASSSAAMPASSSYNPNISSPPSLPKPPEKKCQVSISKRYTIRNKQP